MLFSQMWDRQVQILVITNNSEFQILKSPYNGREMGDGMGDTVDIHKQTMPF